MQLFFSLFPAKAASLKQQQAEEFDGEFGEQ
jgi:hypothetical protein